MTAWTVARQVPLSMEISWKEYWSGWSFPFLEVFPTQELNLSLWHYRQNLTVWATGKPIKQDQAHSGRYVHRILIDTTNQRDLSNQSVIFSSCAVFFSLLHTWLSLPTIRHSVTSDSLRPHGLQHVRLPCHHQLLELAQIHHVAKVSGPQLQHQSFQCIVGIEFL